MRKKKRHTYRFSVIEHYAQTIEVTASSCLEADKIARELASKLSLGKDYTENNADINLDKIVEVQLDDDRSPEDRLDKIAEETTVNWYQTMLPWQRKELSQEELYKYAEEMRKALERILDITGEVDRAVNRIYRT